MKDFIKQLFKVTAILVAALILCSVYVLWKLHVSEKYFKYYGSYVVLENLASGLDDYEKENKFWPKDLNELVRVRPDLANDLTDLYGNAVVFVPYDKSLGYGKLISYGRDGRLGGQDHFDRDLEIRYPTETETNRDWNQRLAAEFKSRTARGLW